MDRRLGHKKAGARCRDVTDSTGGLTAGFSSQIALFRETCPTDSATPHPHPLPLLKSPGFAPLLV